MALDFLPNLPKADLDDRRYQDLVQECLLRLSRYCPEWTNHNPSDPGVTLIELFAWLTDQMLMRFNQVPRRNYVAFLELLGIRLQPPTPAQTEVTFYLVSELSEPYTIPSGIEICTERTATEAAIVFSTNQPVIIGHPRIRHFLSAETAATPVVLRDRFSNVWGQRQGQWEGPELSLFNEQPQVGNCFYLVLEPEDAIEGNVLALTLKGQEATPTGINPNAPPRCWEAWNGTAWVPVLLQETDDQTQGFSFNDMTQQGGNPLQGADVVLHLPLIFPVTQFTAYRGRWLRCVHTSPHAGQPTYSQSPRLVGISVRSIGGTAIASQCEVVMDELLGISDGKPGQAFQLQSAPVLARRSDEFLLVTPPGETPEMWHEVADFSDSGPDDRHYVVDSITGVVQFGPLVREPSRQRQQTELHTRLLVINQTIAASQAGAIASPESSRHTLSLNQVQQELRELNQLERQYGAAPPKGATLRMARYRTGGGQRGNVQRGTLTVLKSAVPYVSYVTNHIPAFNGSDAESIEQAAIRVPQLLRTNNRAVTVEDFETLTLLGSNGAVARVRCLPSRTAGVVQLLIVPSVSLDGINRRVGIPPEQFALTRPLQAQLQDYLDERRPLGVEVQYREPNYVGVTVQTEVALEPDYQHTEAREAMQARLQAALYRFLNPITGGRNATGWGFGQAVYPSDIVALFQQIPGIRHIGVVQLFELRQQEQGWVRLPPAAAIYPEEFSLICSWADEQLRSAHIINILQ
jgi:predicted phage baseplate assembly protein